MQQSKGQQDPTYLGRGVWQGSVAAGASAQSTKFAAFAALQLMSINPVLTTLGTSTYTVNGTATISAQQLSLIIITNTSTTTTSALSTTTIGPFTSGYNISGTATATAGINVATQYALNTNTGTTGLGGVAVPQGSVMYVVSGTDATAVSVFTIDYQIAAGSAVTI